MRAQSSCVKMSVSAFFSLAVVSLVQSALAEPRIAGWSNTKTGDAKMMFLAKPGEKITFSVKAKETEKYAWRVNKKIDKAAAGGTFVWTVPDEKGIWEIHLKATGDGKESHQEWVVSTLPKKEAPDIFDYFTDKRYAKRSQTDPWGRPPPNWYTVSDQPPPDPSRCWLQATSTGAVDDESNVNSTLYLPSDIAFGTWKFRYLLPASRYDGYGGWTHMRFCFIGAEDPAIQPFWYVRSMDSHNYTGLGHMNRIDHDIGWAPVRKLWQEVKIIRTRDGDLFTWVDDVFQFRGRELRGQKATSLNIKLAHYRPDRNPSGTICADMVEVYRDRYLFPPKSIRYGQYIHDWTWGQRGPMEIQRWFDFDKTPTLFRVPPRPVAIPLSRYSLNRYPRNYVYLPVLKRGIVVEGRGVRLQDIAASLRRSPSLFQYDRKTKTAVCRTNLVISEGAELVLDGETLKFDCKTDGQHEFAVMFGSTLNAKNSTITTINDHYFGWRFASITHFGYHCGPIHTPRYTGPSYISNLWYHGLCSVFLHGSTINNCGYLFLSSPMQLDITDTNFTNLHEVDTAEYERLYGRQGRQAAKSIKNRFKGKKGFWLGLFGTQMSGFNFRNARFSGKASPINLTFFLSDDVADLRSGAGRSVYKIDIYNVDAPAENIVVRKGLRIRGYRRPEECESTLGLVNARFRKIVIPTEKARAVVKYYLDVKVVDAQGKPVSNAKIKVTNEVDNAAYPAENENGTWILADYVQDKSGKKEFTYTVEATTPDGKRGKTVSVNPDASWYRPDAKTPTVTVKVVVK